MSAKVYRRGVRLSRHLVRLAAKKRKAKGTT